MLKSLVKPKSVKPVNALKQSGEVERKSVLTKIKAMMPAMPNKKTMVDVTLFAATLYVIVRHGKDIAGAMDGMVPTE